MYKILYSPKSREDMFKIMEYLTLEFSKDIAKEKMKNLTTSIKKLEEFPLIGKPLGNLIDVSTDYLYMVTEKSYVFYRNEDNHVKIIRVLNHRQEFMRILFGIYEVDVND